MRDMLRGVRLIMWAGFRASPRLAFFGFTLEPISSFAGTASALYLKWIVEAVGAGDPAAVRTSALGLAVTMAAGQILAAIGWRLRTKLLERTGTWLEARILELSASLPGLEHHERHEYHDRLQDLHGTDLGNSIFSIVPGTAAFVRIVLTAGLLGTVHPALVGLPLFAIPSVLFGVRAQAIQHEAWKAAGPHWRLANALYALTIGAGSAKELRVFGLQDRVRARHQAERDTAITAQARAGFRAATWHAMGWAVFGAGYISALALVSVRARTGDATIGDLMLAITLAAQLNVSVNQFATEVQDLVRRIHSAQHFLWLEDLVRADTADGTAPPPTGLTDGIRFEHVSFTYPGTDVQVLDDVDLVLPAGTRVAIVGDNGAGKTTLVKLLCGFYRPTRGRITVDGVDLRMVDHAGWRERLAGGFQDYCRFEFRAGETVGVGDLPRKDDEPSVVDALDRAGAREVPSKLENGLATQLGKSFDDGAELSMGQWQKLALGRAFMRAEPLVLMLDEPTSSLDAPTEHALFASYTATARERSASGAITILVSHRFSTVRNADLIVVLDGGAVRELGTHDELLARDGLYAELFTLQAAAYR